MRPALPNSTSMRSVPAETSVQCVRISTSPAPGAGHGTSAISVVPLPMFCSICFICRFLVAAAFPRVMWSRSFHGVDQHEQAVSGRPAFEQPTRPYAARERQERALVPRAGGGLEQVAVRKDHAD